MSSKKIRKRRLQHARSMSKEARRENAEYREWYRDAMSQHRANNAALANIVNQVSYAPDDLRQSAIDCLSIIQNSLRIIQNSPPNPTSHAGMMRTLAPLFFSLHSEVDRNHFKEGLAIVKEGLAIGLQGKDYWKLRLLHCLQHRAEIRKEEDKALDQFREIWEEIIFRDAY